MTQTQYAHALNQELQKLNEKIDLKIVYGESYASEARRHKMLLEQARKLKRKKLGQFVSKFISPFFKS
jgi:hypothetical protein